MTADRPSGLKDPADPWERMIARLFNSVSHDTGELDQRLFEAAKSGDIAAMRDAIDNGADLYRQDAIGATLLIWGICMQFPSQSVRFLIERMDRLDQQDKQGRTALFCAACYGHVQYIRPLIEKGADETIRDAMGKTALQVAKLSHEKNAYMELMTAIAERQNHKVKCLRRAVRGSK